MPGDVNLNGVVGFDDFTTLSGNFDASEASWEDGDLDGNGKVEFADFLILSANIWKSQPVLAATSQLVTAN